MIFKYREVEIFYKFDNKRKECTNIFLHGWGCDHTKMEPFASVLKNQNTLFVDFPPFGKSGENIKGWTIFTYANMLIALCEHLKIEKFNLVGHSFGGRIAILLAVLCKQKTDKLVLVSSAGMRPRRSLKYYFKVFAYKIKKKLHRDISKYGSKDYRSMKEEIKPVFVNVVNTHLDEFVPLIKNQTIIINGEDDKATPPYMAKRLHKKIKGSKLCILKNCGHFCFEEKRVEVLLLVKEFLS